MIQNRYWHRMPSEATVKALRHFTWGRQDELSPASTTVALMLYVALHFLAHDEVVDEDSLGIQTHARIATATYDELMHAIGTKSRTLVTQGLTRLENLSLITRLGSHQKRRYRLPDTEPGWFKLPCQAILRQGVIVPFENLSLRSVRELHALKVYLYLAARRDNKKPYTQAAYDNISLNTGVPERYIRKALVTLTACGLLEDIKRERDHQSGVGAYGPNTYFLRGHAHLFQTVTLGRSETLETSPASAPSPLQSYADHL